MVILDESLFICDASRGKWLSSETMIYPFGRGGDVFNQYLDYASVTNGNSGAKLLKNATIIEITAESSCENATKSFDIELSTSTSTFSLVDGEHSSNIVDIDVNEDDYKAIFVRNAGTDVTNPTVILHLKWRE